MKHFLLFACILVFQFVLKAQVSTLNRPNDPVVLSGAQLTTFSSLTAGEIVGFKFVNGNWSQIPIQVDEKELLDIMAPYGPNANSGNYVPDPSNPKISFYCDSNTYTGADSNTSFDSDDELVFMAKDAGGQSNGTSPSGIVNGTCKEIAITDPLGGTGYVYLFQNGGTLQQGAGTSYISYSSNLSSTSGFPSNGSGPNLENTTITTSKYIWHFSAEWVSDKLQLIVGNNTDLLDRYKSFFANGNCLRHEDAFSAGENAYVCVKAGPIRAIRSYMGAVSGPLTQRTHLFYESRQDIATDLRVHNIVSVFDAFDYTPAANGMTYRNNLNTSGATIDGLSDAVTIGVLNWEQVSGSQGTISIVHRTATNMTGSDGYFLSYYDDNAANPASNCTGDGQAWGTSGVGIHFSNGNVCTDPLSGCASQFLKNITTKRTIYMDAPNGASNTASAYDNQLNNALSIAVSSCQTVSGYSISTSSNPPAGGNTTGGGVYTSGASVTVVATANTGYTFSNWTESGNNVSNNSSYNFTATGNRNLVANFTPNNYTVSTTSNPVAGGSTLGGGTFAYGTSVTVNSSNNAGYTFVNWTENGNIVSTNQNYTFTLTGNSNLVANFSTNNYTITTSSNPVAGGTTTGAGTFAYGSSITVVATANTGYNFINWTENGNIVSTNPSYNFSIIGNKNLVANFSTNTYTVTTSSNPVAGGSTLGGGTFPFGTSVTVNASNNTGYTFLNWTENGNIVSTNQNYNFTLTGNINLVANFSPNNYVITTSSNPVAGGTTSGAGTYAYGTTVTVTATATTGYSFVNWKENGNIVSTNPNYSFTITGNKNLVAYFTPNNYTITTSSNPVAGGSTSGGGTFAYGTSITVHATVNTGYTFNNWTENGNILSTNPNYNFTVAGNLNLVANFSPNSHTISTFSNPVAGGTTNGGGTFSFGSTVTVNAVTTSGYTFSNWTENGNSVSTNPSYSFTVSGNRNLVANFTLNSYTITTSSNPTGGGTTTGGGTFSYGTSVTVNATTFSGYLFINWTENGNIVSTSTSFNFTITGNKNLVANFVLTSANYNVTTSSNPIAGGTTTGSGSYLGGTTVSVTASPATGYTFVNWTENGNIVSASLNYNFIIVGNRNLVANFILTATYTITTTSNPPAGGNINGGGSFAAGTSITVTAAPNIGYTFIGWTENGNILGTNPSLNYTVTGNSTLVANFTQATYNVTASSNPAAGGNITGGGTFSSGASVTVTATASSGYTFINWTDNGNIASTNASYNFTVFGNKNLVANFVLTGTYNITTSSNPVGGGNTTGGGAYAAGTSVTVNATTNTGYTFVNWTISGNIVSLNPGYTFTVTGNSNLVANFVLTASYSITTSSNPGTGGNTTGGGTFSTGAAVSVTATPNSGYTFVSWTVNGNIVSTNQQYNFTVSGSLNLIANFVLTTTFTVTTSANPIAGGSTLGDGSYPSGVSVTVLASTNSGYAFVNWTENGNIVSTNPGYTFNISGNIVLVANFVNAINYTVTTSSYPTIGGNTTGGGIYLSGSSATVTAIPNAGFTFVDWTENGNSVSTNPSYNFTIAGNTNLVANFILNTYTITTSSNPVAGGITTGGGTFTYGASVTINAIPDSGYLFVDWTESGNLITTNPNYTFTVTGSLNFEANFIRPTNYTITTSSNPVAGGTIMGDGIYASGSSVTLIATSNVNYAFLNWTSNGNIISADSTFNFVIASDSNIVGNFIVVNGISENPDQDDLIIYPNPGNGYVNVTSTSSATSSLKRYDLKIFNSIGELVYSNNLINPLTRIELPYRGIYLFQFEKNGELVKSKKVVITN